MHFTTEAQRSQRDMFFPFSGDPSGMGFAFHGTGTPEKGKSSRFAKALCMKKILWNILTDRRFHRMLNLLDSGSGMTISRIFTGLGDPVSSTGQALAREKDLCIQRTVPEFGFSA